MLWGRCSEVLVQHQRDGFYQGRRLFRPHEEVTDQGLGFDLGTLMARRSLLRAFGAGAAALGLAACGGEPGSDVPRGSVSGATSLPEIPGETQGPFPGDGSNGPDILERSGVIRGDIRANLDGTNAAAGVRLDIELRVGNLAAGGRPLTDAAVYVWQCDRDGRYSMYGDGVTQDTFLRGVQIVDLNGSVQFTTVFPGCYPGRWPHVHFEVYPDRASIADHTSVLKTSQLAFPARVCAEVYRQDGYQSSAANLAEVSLDTDMVFRDDGAVLQTATVTGNPAGGYRATLDVGIG